MNVVTCEKCGRKYGYSSGGNPWPGGKDREYAVCPYCGAEGPSEFISGFITSYKLEESDSEQKDGEG